MKTKLFAIAILSGLMALSGCGGRTKAQSVASLMGGLSGDTSAKAVLKSRAIHQLAVAQKHRDLLNNFAATVKPTTAFCDAIQDGVKPDPNCAISSCSGNDLTDLSITISCTELNMTTTCGNDTFELSNFNYAFTLAYTSTTASFSVDMNGSVNGGAFSNTALDCNMGMTVDLSATAAADYDCSDVNFTCTVGGEALTCADIESAAASETCSAK